MRFITPCAPVLAKAPPIGPEWLHEVKFDGWRVQIHRRPEVVKVYSRYGRDITDLFPPLLEACLYLPECVIDGERVACDTDGKPDFSLIMRREGYLCIWCFDLLADGDQDIRAKPLVERKAKLRDIVTQTDDDRLPLLASLAMSGPLSAQAQGSQAADRSEVEHVHRRDQSGGASTRFGVQVPGDATKALVARQPPPDDVSFLRNPLQN